MNKFKAFVWSALALILLVSGGIADTLKIGHIAGRTGWLKGPALSATVAVDMAVKEINAAGGINGKMIEIIEFDSERIDSVQKCVSMDNSLHAVPASPTIF